MQLEKDQDEKVPLMFINSFIHFFLNWRIIALQKCVCHNTQTVVKMGQLAFYKIGVDQNNTLEFEALCGKASNFEINFLAY